MGYCLLKETIKEDSIRLYKVSWFFENGMLPYL